MGSSVFFEENRNRGPNEKTGKINGVWAITKIHTFVIFTNACASATGRRRPQLAMRRIVNVAHNACAVERS